MNSTVKNINKATENLETLTEFDITQDGITQLITSAEDFNALIAKPTILSQKHAALNNIKELFNEDNNLLKLKLDNFFMIFKELKSYFINGYKKARIVIDN